MGVAVHNDDILMRVLTHESGVLRREGAKALGTDALRAAAEACDASGEHLRAAELIFAVAAIRGTAAGADLQRAWASLKLLEEAGRGSSASRAHESKVLNALFWSTEGGFVLGSPEQVTFHARVRELASRGSMAPKELMESQFGLGQAAFNSSLVIEGGITTWNGPVTREMLEKAHGELRQSAEHNYAAAAAAPDVPTATAISSWASFYVSFARMHTLPEYEPEAVFGPGGARLREIIDNYDFETCHPVAKAGLAAIDIFM